METDVPGHTADLRTAVLEKISSPRKAFCKPELSKIPERRDELNFQTKISNLTDKAMSGAASLQILNAETNEDISSSSELAQPCRILTSKIPETPWSAGRSNAVQ
ncbi:hypothetical protein EJ377_18180 [Chryseobacterium arthrosphaerae]|uniref:Uncharacterized protein n=1 Tax=Chryseobacterium arthrosphaerae TaxID=651561 RepID=A0A3S0QFK9_9FLAO|nr:hypothetical protein EJ377_18180 [Chryseobacterium arthrosphaerae]